MKAFKIKPKA